MATIGNKKEMYRLLKAGVLGNTLRQWDTPQAVVAYGFNGRVAIRSHTPGGEFMPNVPIGDIVRVATEYMARNNCGALDMAICEMEAHGNRKIASIEVGHVHGVLVGMLSTSQALFREAMKHARHETGPRMRLTLKAVLDMCDYEHICTLMDCYTESSFELTCYERPLGVMHTRMIVWEGRDY